MTPVKTDRCLLSTLLKSAELEHHPHLGGRPFEITHGSLLRHDLRVHLADLGLELIESVCLHSHVLMVGAHLGQLLLSSFSLGAERLPLAFRFVKCFFPSSDGFHLLTYGIPVSAICCECRGELEHQSR